MRDKKPDFYVKLSIASFVGMVLTALSMVFFVLMPIYSLAGTNSGDADLKLDAATTKLRFFQGLMVLFVLLFAASLTAAILKLRKK